MILELRAKGEVLHRRYVLEVDKHWQLAGSCEGYMLPECSLQTYNTDVISASSMKIIWKRNTGIPSDLPSARDT